jgi:hypothetical protein
MFVIAEGCDVVAELPSPVVARRVLVADLLGRLRAEPFDWPVVVVRLLLGFLDAVLVVPFLWVSVFVPTSFLRTRFPLPSFVSDAASDEDEDALVLCEDGENSGTDSRLDAFVLPRELDLVGLPGLVILEINSRIDAMVIGVELTRSFLLWRRWA